MVKLEIFKVPVTTIRRLFGANPPYFEGHIQPIAATRRTYFFVRDPSSQAPSINQQIASMEGHAMNIDEDSVDMDIEMHPPQRQDIQKAVVEMKDTFNMSDLYSAIHSLRGGSTKSISKGSNSRSRTRSRGRHQRSRSRSRARSKTRYAK